MTWKVWGVRAAVCAALVLAGFAALGLLGLPGWTRPAAFPLFFGGWMASHWVRILRKEAAVKRARSGVGAG
ncbi:hypothetical protein [Kitasatospora paranensis]|uniref:Uncharacterized protein n=1 Tax=Kitasatospora paranensis TaxID=258053 RepID=A0ABW2FUL5_9ACTN